MPLMWISNRKRDLILKLNILIDLIIEILSDKIPYDNKMKILTLYVELLRSYFDSIFHI